MKLLIVAAVLIIGFGFCLADKGSPPVPVVLVTSLTGATLECKLEHAHPPHVYCSKNKDWFTIWYEDSMFIPGFDECFFHDFAPIFNENTRTFENAPGVQIRPKGFGDIVEAESIKKGKKDMLPLYKSFVGNLTEHLGYVRNVDIKAAQYDWRLAPPQLSEYFSQLKEMVEQMYIDRGNRPVLLIAHSYGNNIAHAFLRNMPQEWKDKYVDSYVAVAPPHQGSFDALITMLVEFEFHSLPLNAKIMRSLIRSLPAIYYLLPNPESYDADFPVVELGNTNYTASQFADLFSAVGLGASKDIYNLFKNESCNIEDPGVDVFAVYSSNLPTPDSLRFASSDINEKPIGRTMTKGDGTVSAASLTTFKRWARSSGVDLKTIPHGKEIMMEEGISAIMKILKDRS